MYQQGVHCFMISLLIQSIPVQIKACKQAVVKMCTWLYRVTSSKGRLRGTSAEYCPRSCSRVWILHSALIVQILVLLCIGSAHSLTHVHCYWRKVSLGPKIKYETICIMSLIYKSWNVNYVLCFTCPSANGCIVKSMHDNKSRHYTSMCMGHTL